MKRTALLILSVIIVLSIYATGPIKYINDQPIVETQKEATTTTASQQEILRGPSYWSVTLEAGLNRFDGDVQQQYNSLIPKSLNKFTLGGSVEYTISSAWSIGADYYYLPLSALYKKSNGFIKADFKSQMHNVSLFTSFNFVRGFLPHYNGNWGVWANIGLGYAAYSSTYYTDNAGKGSTNGHGQKYVEFNDTIKDGRAMFIPVGVLIEYNFTKNFALGLKTQIRSFNKDYIERRIQAGVTNDFVEMSTLQARFKLNAKEHDHRRNPLPVDYQSQIDKLQEKVNNIVIPVIPEIPNYDEKIKDLDKRVKKMEDILCPDGPDTDGDGVPDCRDREPNTPKGNQVNFWGESIKAGETISEEAYIYFDFDKVDLDSEGNRAIAIAARKLQKDPTLIVEVRGFTDNMGDSKYNQGLSQRRADKVKTELVNVYGIAPDRIIPNGKGKYNPKDKTIPFRPYRTCVLFYNKE